MAKSRYTDVQVIDNHHFSTFSLPVFARGYRELNLLENVNTLDYVYKRGDRLDHLAARFFNEDQYWWVIAIVNGIIYPFPSGGLIPGRTLKIPLDPRDIFEKLFR